MHRSTRWTKLSRSHVRTAVGALCGLVAGGLYAHFVGCRTGTCPITSSIWSSGLLGAAFGAIAGWPAPKA